MNWGIKVRKIRVLSNFLDLPALFGDDEILAQGFLAVVGYTLGICRTQEYSIVPDCAHGQKKNIMGIFCKNTA